MSEELPKIGDIVFCRFCHVEPCEVVDVDEKNGEIEVEHQVSDGIETVRTKEWHNSEGA